MMHVPRTLCNKAGCGRLAVPGNSYCKLHTNEQRHRESLYFKEPWKRKFYTSYEWHKCSIAFRKTHTLCFKCQELFTQKKVITINSSELVHHDPELGIIIKNGWNPFSWDYLKAYCWPCHNTEHKKGVVKSEKKKVKHGTGVPACFKHLI